MKKLNTAEKMLIPVVRQIQELYNTRREGSFFYNREELNAKIREQNTYFMGIKNLYMQLHGIEYSWSTKDEIKFSLVRIGKEPHGEQDIYFDVNLVYIDLLEA